MKKVLIYLITLSILLSGVFVLTGCDKDNSEKKKEEVETASLIDEYMGYKVTIDYPKDSNIKVDEKIDNNQSKTILVDDNFEITLSYQFNKNLDSQKESDKYSNYYIKEFKANSKEGFISVHNNQAWGYLSVVSEKNTFDINDSVRIVVKEIKKSDDKESVKNYIDTDKFTKILESIKFEKIPTKEVKGKTSYDHSFGVGAKEMDEYKILYHNLNLNDLSVHIFKDKEEDKKENALAYISVIKYQLNLAKTPKELAEKEYGGDSSTYKKEIKSKKYGDNKVYFLEYKENEKRKFGFVEIDGQLFELDINEKKGLDNLDDFIKNVVENIYLNK